MPRSPHRSVLCLAALLCTLAAKLEAQHRLLVRFAAHCDVAAELDGCDAYLTQVGGTPELARVLPSVEGERLALVESDRDAAFWRGLPRVIGVTPDLPVYERHPPDGGTGRAPNDPVYPAQWNLQNIEAPGAWGYTTGGRTAGGQQIVIAVIERYGFQLDHPDLYNRYFTNPGELADNGIDDDGNGYVDDVHGWNFDEERNGFQPSNHPVQVSAIIGAHGDNGVLSAGINWDIRILPLQVKNVPEWIAAVQYVTALRDRYNATGGAEGAFVVASNHSLGLPGKPCDVTPELNEAFERAGRAGILTVGATDYGTDVNEVPDLPSTCPSEYLVVVTSSDRQDQLMSNASYGAPYVDLAAPGARFRNTTFSAFGNQADSFNGTSAAAPHVAGTAGLLYAVDCPALETLARDDPAGATRLVRDALLATVDPQPSLRATTVTGGRLNARRAVEAILRAGCPVESAVVRFADAGSVRSEFSFADGGSLSLVRGLGEAWDTYLYAYSGAVSASLDAATAELVSRTGILAAESNFRMRPRARTPDDPGYRDQDALREIRAPQAWQNVYDDAPPRPTDVVTAIFDQDFSLDDPDLVGRLYVNAREVAGNRVDDDGNGYVDDVSGYNLTGRAPGYAAGAHGHALTAIIAATADNRDGTAGLDWAGLVLPLQGCTLDEWVEGAAYVAGLRADYNATGGAAGALVVSYLTAQGGTRHRSPDAGEGTGVVESVLDELLDLGILTVGALPNDTLARGTDFPGAVRHPALLTVGALDTSGRELGGLRTDAVVAERPTGRVYAPGQGVAYGLDSSGATFRLSGTSAAAALVAGTVALMYQVPGDALSPAAEPAAALTRVRDLLETSTRALAQGAPESIDADLATLRLRGGASPLGYRCRAVRVGPSPVAGGTPVVARVEGDPAEVCPLRTYDALGRVVFSAELELPGGVADVELPASSWAPGIYYVATAGGIRQRGVSFIVRH